jgi:hypothetical protein
VPDEQKLLFQTDLNRFWEIVYDDDAEARFATLKTLDDLLLCEVIRYGVLNQEEMIGPLAGFYRGPVMKMPEEQRFAIYRHVAGFVEHTSIVSTNAFLPFIAEDDEGRIVSTAVIDYVSLGPLTNGDPMSRVKDIIGMIESNMLENEGAAFGALLHIGDGRVCDLLIPLRDSLDRDAISNAVKCSTGFIHSATADFLSRLVGGDGRCGSGWCIRYRRIWLGTPKKEKPNGPGRDGLPSVPCAGRHVGTMEGLPETHSTCGICSTYIAPHLCPRAVRTASEGDAACYHGVGAETAHRLR